MWTNKIKVNTNCPDSKIYNNNRNEIGGNGKVFSEKMTGLKKKFTNQEHMDSFFVMVLKCTGVELPTNSG